MIILITGASGFIGSALTEKLSCDGHLLICQSRFFHHSTPNTTWIKHDLVADSWDALSLPSIDVVYHLAGQTSTYQAKNHPLDDLSSNLIGFVRLLDFLKGQTQPPFVVLTGTATQVGITDQVTITENLPDKPLTFYDISKYAAEMYLMQYIKEGWISGCTLRLANVFGRYKLDRQGDRGIIDKMFRRAATGQPITIYGDGLCLRDYVFIDDIITALVLATINKKNTNGRKFCIGTGKGTTVKDAFLKIIDFASKLTGTSTKYYHLPDPTILSEIEFRNAVIDSSSFREATGWVPKYDLETGIEAAYSSYKFHP
jgi:nucleoside-diphosphate-sugar epimerase